MSGRIADGDAALSRLCSRANVSSQPRLRLDDEGSEKGVGSICGEYPRSYKRAVTAKVPRTYSVTPLVSLCSGREAIWPSVWCQDNMCALTLRKYKSMLFCKMVFGQLQFKELTFDWHSVIAFSARIQKSGVYVISGLFRFIYLH